MKTNKNNLPLNSTMNIGKFKKFFKFGSGKWDRTTDLGLMSPAL